MPWFEEAGGNEPLAKRLKGLDGVLAHCEGKTVLDLGGAEGLIAREFVRLGAASALVVDREAGEFLHESVMFMPGDLNRHPVPSFFHGAGLVLALSVAQKLDDPAGFLRWAATLGDTLVVRAPGETFRRKGDESGPEISVKETLADLADLVDEPETFAGAWMGVFEVRK